MPSEQRRPHFSTLPNEPIGVLPDGSINVVKMNDPPFQPEILDGRCEEFDLLVRRVLEVLSRK